jgi:hypothetical protein
VKTALAIGLGAVGLYFVWQLAQRAQAMPTVVAPPPQPGPTSLADVGEAIAVRSIMRLKQAVVELATGTSGSQFKTFDEETDFSYLKYLMRNCDAQGAAGNDPTSPASNSCKAVQQMAPGTKCRGGGCDQNPADLGGHRFAYRYFGENLTGTYGSKSLATAFINPATGGGVQAPSSAEVGKQSLLKALGFAQ